MANNQNGLLKRIQDSRLKVETVSKNLKKANSRFIYISIIASSLATLLSGLTAALGPLAGQGAPAWKITCGGVAVLTAFAGIFTGLHQRMSIPERLSKCYLCLGKLNSLELALTVTKRDPLGVAKDFEDVIVSYQDFLY